MEYFYDVAKEMQINQYLKNLKENTLFIYSPTSLKKIKIDNKYIIKENWHNISKDIKKIENYIEKLDGIDKVISFGGGSTIDIGKYISYKLNTEYICIPSMLSTNSYSTNKVALIDNDKKITLQAKMPDKIIIDNDVLKLSKNENLYGLADVLSIYTALYDWKIANEDINEKINENIYNQANTLLYEVLQFINNNSFDNIIENNIELFKFIGIAGYITNLYGTGRPESGSEHIMAKEIEQNIDIPHGMSVSVGILLMSLVQKRFSNSIYNAITKMKIFENCKKYGLTKEIIKKSFLNLVPRKDRYSIINRYYKNVQLKNENIIKFFEIIEGI
ncbi:MAG: iron-containing alcohol dehydrogenase [Clostridia bacterium]|nr:iron-containing alcohol dehydrogenase [Clostridia bacterium]